MSSLRGTHPRSLIRLSPEMGLRRAIRWFYFGGRPLGPGRDRRRGRWRGLHRFLRRFPGPFFTEQIALAEPDRQSPVQSLRDHHPTSALARIDRRQQLVVPVRQPVRRPSRGLGEPPVVLRHHRRQQRICLVAGWPSPAATPPPTDAETSQTTAPPDPSPAGCGPGSTQRPGPPTPGRTASGPPDPAPPGPCPWARRCCASPCTSAAADRTSAATPRAGPGGLRPSRPGRIASNFPVASSIIVSTPTLPHNLPVICGSRRPSAPTPEARSPRPTAPVRVPTPLPLPQPSANSHPRSVSTPTTNPSAANLSLASVGPKSRQRLRCAASTFRRTAALCR